MHLRQLREVFANAFCKDPRDRVYAVLDMLDEEEKAFGIVPDYTRDVLQVYEDVAVRWITHYASLNILLQCEFQPGRSPSWVPDWSTPSQSHTSTAAFASSHSLAWSQVVGPGVLRVAGVSTMRITEVHPLRIRKNSSVPAVVNAIRGVLPGGLLYENPPNMGKILDVYCTTFLCGRFRESEEPPRLEWSSRGECRQVLQTLAAEPYMYRPEEYNRDTVAYKVINSASDRMDGNLFFKASGGYIGLAPPSVQPGDEVCVLLGCDSPMVLRPYGDHGYQLVGPSYVPGIVDGDGLLGPLPDNIRMFKVPRRGGSVYTTGFMDRTSGAISFADPRLSSLTENYDRFVCALEENPFSRVNLSPDILRERGVDMVCFDLV